MGPRAPSLTSAIAAAALVLGAAAYAAFAHGGPAGLTPVDIGEIPADTVDAESPGISEQNGLFYLEGQPFSGVVREWYEGGTVKRLTSALQGRRHGLTTTFYLNGTARDVRSYRDNLAYGRHHGYWEDGTLKFDFNYVDDRREGMQQQWYRSGRRYTVLNFHDDREAGMQQAWRESGRLFANYEARDGNRYGLQKSALCSETLAGGGT